MKKLATKPHFAEIAQALTEGISTGQYPVGSVLPGELDLCSLYNTSRHTIRAALHELQQLGLVSRKKNAGTRVESATPKNDFRPSLGSLEDLVQFGTTNVRVVQSVEELVVGSALAKKLGCNGGTAWLRFSSIRADSGNGKPVGWTDVYIDTQYAAIEEMVREEPDTLISTLIERRYGRRVAEIRQVVRGILIEHPAADALGVTPGSAGLEIIRQYIDAAGQIFEISVSTHPSDRFVISMKLERSVAAT
ncbi:GntR family transcriptional regulator [Herbaspirillum sp. LeCh32-8]|uniref:GntR family transcriptional regulator n=1 Tax=Herbaspirillum sp. LeCh32-8 TaxID=2821356 RepID=UPI001AE42797|nr:GntR family transcriptional regulator [Herbaspirillum sp. LeCh32-8]MBP0598858.1 GntR family transcriptional regulator [Herbaspirillum sp. LeCh32-8]